MSRNSPSLLWAGEELLLAGVAVPDVKLPKATDGDVLKFRLDRRSKTCVLHIGMGPTDEWLASVPVTSFTPTVLLGGVVNGCAGAALELVADFELPSVADVAVKTTPTSVERWRVPDEEGEVMFKCGCVALLTVAEAWVRATRKVAKRVLHDSACHGYQLWLGVCIQPARQCSSSFTLPFSRALACAQSLLRFVTRARAVAELELFADMPGFPGLATAALASEFDALEDGAAVTIAEHLALVVHMLMDSGNTEPGVEALCNDDVLAANAPVNTPLESSSPPHLRRHAVVDMVQCALPPVNHLYCCRHTHTR